MTSNNLNNSNTINKKKDTNSNKEDFSALSAEEIATKARIFIGNYCMTKCKAKCCRGGAIILHSKEVVDAMSQGQKNSAKLIEEKTIIQRKDGLYEFNLAKQQCPSLTTDFKCLIFNNKNRPQMCVDFPIFVRGNMLMVASFCPATTDGTLDDFYRLFEEKNLKIFWQ